MENQTAKYWIVLVNKVPQGPYAEDQLKDLLNTQKLRRNEVGMLVSEDGATPLSCWKILWQFKQFIQKCKYKKNSLELPPMNFFLFQTRPK